jgi:ferric-dicitrate binding protein FerR (iron transport regulator)
VPQAKEQKTAEELERAENSPAAPTAAEQTAPLMQRLERESEPLQRGEALETPLGPLPLRSLAAIGLFVAVAVAVYLVLWALLGTLGLLLGWIPAAALGLLAARELGRRAAA